MLLRFIIEMLVLMIKNTGIACIAIPIQVSVFMILQVLRVLPCKPAKIVPDNTKHAPLKPAPLFLFFLVINGQNHKWGTGNKLPKTSKILHTAFF